MEAGGEEMPREWGWAPGNGSPPFLETDTETWVKNTIDSRKGTGSGWIILVPISLGDPSTTLA